MTARQGWSAGSAAGIEMTGRNFKRQVMVVRRRLQPISLSHLQHQNQPSAVLDRDDLAFYFDSAGLKD